MRMPLPGRVSGLGAFEASIYRCFSLPFYLISWHSTGLGRGSSDYWTNERHVVIRSQLPNNAELMNSTRGYAPGLIDPMKGEAAGNRIPWPSNVDKDVGVERASGSIVLAASRVVRQSPPPVDLVGGFGAPVPIPEGMWDSWAAFMQDGVTDEERRVRDVWLNPELMDEQFRLTVTYPPMHRFPDLTGGAPDPEMFQRGPLRFDG